MTATVLFKSVDIAIPGYRILRPLGEGGMASVFLAVQESLDREVALKIMAPALAANAEFTERFVKEGKITAKLSHPNLVTVFDIGSHGSIYYLAAEHSPGSSLREKIQAGMSVAEVLDVACDVARGLEYAHQKGFVHRDVKPGNILFKADGSAVLADFGIAKAIDAKSGATLAGASIGTPDYMSPEQARAEPVDGRSDIYALGAVVYEMLSGHAPYQASDPFAVALMQVTQPVPTLPAQHDWLQPLIDASMAKMPGHRLRSGNAFIQAVEQLLTAAPQAALIHQQRVAHRRVQNGARHVAATRLTTAAATHRPFWWILTVAALVILLAGIALWVVLGGDAADGDISSSAPAPALAQPIPMTIATEPPIHLPQPIDAPGNEVASLLMQAEAYKDYGTHKEPTRRLIFPPDDNAVDLYQRVLTLDPGNAAATQGLKDIAAFYLNSALKLCERSIWSQCRNLAADGLRVEPENAQLQALVARAELKTRGGG